MEDINKNNIQTSLQPKYSSHFQTKDKPPYSYNSLITYAITNSPNNQLTLNEIYNWISDNYPYFKSANNGWKVCNVMK